MNYNSGDQIYKYRLINLIGGGNSGTVWTADDISLNTRLAVKLLDKNYSIDERLREAQIGNRLQHNNVINIKYADVANYGNPPSPVVIIAMPYYPNGSVVSRLNSANFLDLDKTLKCLIDVLRGLEYLHESGYYHCDIKPNNILIGNSGEYLLTDYGITCSAPNHTAISPISSYLPHESPETVKSNLYDAKTDIYQLGLTAFRLLNGISTIKDDFAKDRDVFRQSILGGIIAETKFQPYVPRNLRRIIMKATEANPDNRYQSALEMRRALEKIRFLGNISADISGNISLQKDGNTYNYEVLSKGKNALVFNAYKQNLKSQRVTKVAKHCCQAKNQKELRKAIQSFCLDIVS